MENIKVSSTSQKSVLEGTCTFLNQSFTGQFKLDTKHPNDLYLDGNFRSEKSDGTIEEGKYKKGQKEGGIKITSH